MSAFFAVWLRTWRKSFRRPVLLTFSLAQPLLWLLLFGFLFHRMRERYLDYLAPGVGAMSVLFGASQSGIGWIRDLQTGFLQRMLRTPTPPPVILAGKLCADTVRLVGQALVVLALALALGARVSIDWALLPFGLLCLALFAFAFAALSSWVALRTGAQEAMAAWVHVVNMPVLFTSTALLPRGDMPEWLAAIGRWNPLSFAVDAWRGALLLGAEPRPLLTLAVLSALSLAMFLGALSALKRTTFLGRNGSTSQQNSRRSSKRST